MMDMPSEAVVQQTIDGILARPEFHSFLDELWLRLIQWLAGLFSDISLATGIPQFVVMIFLTALLLGGLMLVFYLLRSRIFRHAGTLPLFAEDANPWQAAMACAARGDFQAALQWLFAYHLQVLAGRGLIVVHESKTNTQYELELLQQGYADLQQFRVFKRLFNAVRYGGHDMDAQTYAQWQAYCAPSVIQEGQA